MLQGSMVALVTPFDDSGNVDFAGLDRLIEWHIQAGTHAIVAVGTTGESATLTHAEHNQVIAHVVKRVNSRIPVIAGTGSNNTAEAIETSKAAEQAGADFSLSVVPYYNKPCQRGIYAHFEAIASNTSLPILLYNVPGRTAADMADDTTLALARDIELVVGTKDATGDLTRGKYLLDNRPDDFLVISGDDGTALDLTLMGGQGDISVTANVAPALMSEAMEFALAGNADSARAADAKLAGLHQHLFIASSPSPAKYCLNRLGLIENAVRLPLVPTSDEHYPLLESAMAMAELLPTEHS